MGRSDPTAAAPAQDCLTPENPGELALLWRRGGLAPAPERVLERYLDEDEREAVGIARDHLEEAPRLELGLLGDHDAFRLQLLPEHAEIAHLEEEANRAGTFSLEVR